MKTVLTVLAIVALFPAIWLPAQPVRRALIMGNDAYPGHPLHNARNDAEGIDEKLRSFGYKSTLVLNADRKTLTSQIDAFAESLSPGDLAFVYYAGHGLQVDGENYLVPVDFRITYETDVKNQGYSLSAILSKLSEHGATTQVVVLDACRDNPFLSSRSIQNGWAGVVTSAGSFVAFGTAPGSTASDVSGEGHGLFTKSLLLFIDAPLGIEDMFQKVREDVIQKSLGQQIPWTASSLIGSLHIDPKEDASAPATGVALISTLRNQTKRSTVDISQGLRGIPLSLPGEDEVTLLRQADQEMRSLQFAHAIPILQHILEIDPVCALALRLLGVAFELVGRNKEAQSSFARAIALNYNDGVAYSSLCLSKVKESPSEAQLDCRRAISLNPNLPQAHLGLAIGLAAKGSKRLAYDEATLAIKLNPSSPLGYRIRGDIANSLGDPESAQQDYSKADKLSFSNRGTPVIPALEPSQFSAGSVTTPSVSIGAPPPGAAPGVTPQHFGGYGDAFQPPNGCTTTASSTTVVCPDAPFVSTDVGKQIWVSKVGAGGAAFNATITAFISNTTVTVSAAATSVVTNGRAIYGHDDTTAIQSCIKYSSINSIECFLVPAPAPVGQDGLVGFLVGKGGLQLTSDNYLEQGSGPNIVGSSQSGGTNLYCEYNGDCLSLAAGPIQGATISNVDFQEDPSQPNSRGIHLNPQAGTFGNGPFTNSNFYNVNVDNPALECLWLDGGGGPGYAYTLPNQYLQFTQFWCSGPNQSHPANLMLMTGQADQIIFINGQVNGQAWNGTSAPNYPNPLIKITEKTTGQGDTPGDVTFYGYTFEVGTHGLYVGNGANNVHFDNGYVENVSSPFSVTGAVENTFNGNHIANSGNTTAVYQFSSSSGGSVRDTLVYGSVAPPAAFAVCSGNNQVDFANNNSGVTTNSCLYSVAVTGATQGANSCSSASTQTMIGLTTQSVIMPGYSSDPSGLTGWGSTGGMVFQAWPSAANTLSWKVCNQTTSSITYSSITFNVVFK
jgi:tetratricopeptide (TPR) repeat protein